MYVIVQIYSLVLSVLPDIYSCITVSRIIPHPIQLDFLKRFKTNLLLSINIISYLYNECLYIIICYTI
jgi:hypothetical protein